MKRVVLALAVGLTGCLLAIPAVASSKGNPCKTISQAYSASGQLDSWSMTRIQVKVPITVRAGNDRELEVVVSGRRATRSIGVSC